MSFKALSKIRHFYKTNSIYLTYRGLGIVRNISVHSVSRSGNGSEPLYSINNSADHSAILKRIEEEFNNSRSKDRIWEDMENHNYFESDEDFKGISLKRGVTGIYDIEELVDILKEEKLINVAVISVPKELQYVDYLVITTGKSGKQMVAAAEFIRKIAKERCAGTDTIPVLEGRDSKDWIAMDLGNIALHIFSAKCRNMYDLETLWTVGAQYDDLSNAKEEHLDALLNFHN